MTRAGVAGDFPSTVRSYETLDELLHLMNEADLPERVDYDLSGFLPEKFSSSLASLMKA